MTLNEHIDQIRQQLTDELFPNEASVSLCIVCRLLHALDVPIFHPQVLVPEYSLGNKKVDYALCKSPSTPTVFIEVKGVGKIDGSSEEQLFAYAFKKGVQEVVLTDGREWHFFYPGGEGHFGERRVCQLDLLEDDMTEIVIRLEKYLKYSAICSGDAIKAIRRDYNVMISLPEVWRQLLEEPDDDMSEILLESVATKMEHQTGDKPTHDQVLDLLRTLKSEHPKPPTKLPSTSTSLTDGNRKRRNAPPKRLAVIMPDEERIEREHGKDTFLEVIEKLGVERCAPHCPVITNDRGTFTVSQRKEMKEIDGYYVFYGNSNKAAEKHLKKIARGLGESLNVQTPLKSEPLEG